MHAANRFPVTVYDRDARAAYKGGGLAAKAKEVRDAGRYDDTKIIHVTDDELDMLRQQWGEPSINPHTGQPEFGLFGKIFKALKTVAPIATAFIPGVGPLASAAISAGLNAADAAASGKSLGKVLGSAALGGATGYVGGGGLSSLGAKAATTAATNAATSAATNAATNAGSGALKDAAINAVANVAQQAAAPSLAALGSAAPGAASNFAANAATSAGTSALKDAARPNFWNRDFLGLGITKGKYAVPALAAGALAYDLLKKKPKDDSQTAEEFFGPDFAAKSLPASGGQLTNPNQLAPTRDYYGSGYNRYLAEGGEAAGPMKRTDFAVNGPGDGRSDDIPAMLSDGEYVMDAETVAMLGDGSTKAGAKKLDDFRVKIRKHKGAKLAKGKFSAKAKRPEAYMAGGRA